MLEIYREEVRDLLFESETRKALDITPRLKESVIGSMLVVKRFETARDADRGVWVDGLTMHMHLDRDVLELTALGSLARSTASTK